MNSSCKTRFRSPAGGLVVVWALFAGPAVAAGAAMVSDFSLLDVNESSSSYNRSVSPRDYLHQVSAWYFGQAST